MSNVKDVQILMSSNKIDNLQSKCQSLNDNLNESMNIITFLQDQNQKLVSQIKRFEQNVNSAQKKAEYYLKRNEQLMNESDNTRHVNASTEAIVKYFFENLQVISNKKNRNVNNMLEKFAKLLFTNNESEGLFVKKLCLHFTCTL